MKIKLSQTWLSLILLGAFSFTVAGPANAAAGAGPAPNFTLKSLGGKNMKLSEMAGNVVLINFWASWCGPCRLSFPQLEQIRRELGPRGFEILAVNVDEQERDALRFLEELPVTYPVVRDGTGDTPGSYGILGMPTGYLIDREGIVRLVHQGYRKSDGEALRTAIVELLGE